MPRATLSYGQGNANKFAITEWSLPVLRHFQFGDLRIETPSRTVVIEVESGGGTGNLVKYWPMLAAGKPAKQFVLVHIFRISSEGDYGSHMRLWEIHGGADVRRVG